MFSKSRTDFEQNSSNDQKWQPRRVNEDCADCEQVECELERRIQIDHEVGVYSQLISPAPGSLTKKSTPPDDDRTD